MKLQFGIFAPKTVFQKVTCNFCDFKVAHKMLAQINSSSQCHQRFMYEQLLLRVPKHVGEIDNRSSIFNRSRVQCRNTVKANSNGYKC